MPEVAQQAMSLGIAGLLFVMWWYERAERIKSAGAAQKLRGEANRIGELSERLLSVVRANTEALVALRETLHGQHEALREWISRLGQQVDRLEQR
ncbi:MAG: hypothetical protein D6744_17500 [Planctomycetota bacterium]|nr:MAG: hypothetical protein D6744_17500 [Planctomycetota bacterium]